ncbi:hypothetical protein E6O75_ATG01403 [Venturia nashicola]|uniref:Uncharacterized protein n=1 Tax=Venturia nashicola TaxID=86259 RepID=A0A4Z1PDQ9_9PEZI|nr:hypothetical protein E6O75_ATG01403 [Venturia nashicola]
MEPRQERPLPIRNGNFDQLPVNRSNSHGIIGRRSRCKLAVTDSDNSIASADQAIQDSTEQDAIAVRLPPIMRIPTEMRAKIFQYLLPDKSEPIEPTSILLARWEFLREQNDEMIRRVVMRAHAQHHATNQLLGFSQFYGPFDPEIHNTRFQVPYSIRQFVIPLEFSVEQFGDVYDMPEMDGSSSSSFGSGNGWSSPSSSAAATAAPPSAKKFPTELEDMFKDTSTPTKTSFRSGSTVSNDKTQSNIFIDPPSPAQLNNIKAALRQDQYDAMPTNTTLSLMTTHSLFATEIATILYEEYTFDIRISADGIDFLHLPPVATSEHYGDELTTKLAQFQRQGHFCLQRMRHLCFVFVGGDREERTATWRMRRNVQDVVGMVVELASLEVRFSGDDEFWIVDRGVEAKKGVRARMGMRDVSVVEMVCSPLAVGLSGVGKVEVKLPEELEEVGGLAEWKGWFVGKIRGGGEVEKDVFRELKEVAMFEATREWEYRQEILEGRESFAYLEEMEMDVDMEDEEDEEMEDEIETD